MKFLVGNTVVWVKQSAVLTRGAKTGIQAYDHSLSPLPGIGSIAWAIRGPKSRAGLAAYAVGPPNPAKQHHSGLSD